MLTITNQRARNEWIVYGSLNEKHLSNDDSYTNYQCIVWLYSNISTAIPSCFCFADQELRQCLGQKFFLEQLLLCNRDIRRNTEFYWNTLIKCTFCGITISICSQIKCFRHQLVQVLHFQCFVLYDKPFFVYSCLCWSLSWTLFMIVSGNFSWLLLILSVRCCTTEYWSHRSLHDHFMH